MDNRPIVAAVVFLALVAACAIRAWKERGRLVARDRWALVTDFATALATFARNLVRATPTVIGSPTRRRTSVRSRLAISAGVPNTASIPRASRNASSIESASTDGEVSSKISNTARLASA